ncbi:MAG: T9SS type A sorting domain-containing protein [Bacteroidetes bacterium]|nr:T9SS type A sorting domain-containing protein [Bacteroidota bacterium]
MKTNLLKYLVTGVISIFVTEINLVAQSGYNCGTSQANQKVYANDPDLAQAEINNNVLLSQIIKANKQMKAVEQVYTIPVVFHVIHINGSENISDAQIQDQMAILNRDYSKLNADTANVVPAFQGNIADCNIQFALAKKDPNGNCTNGIDRIYSHKTDNANDQSKLNPWPRDKYLNVWIIKTMESVGTAGYAYYPSATSTYLSPYDGIIIIHQYIGSIGTANVTNSRALTHEIGHWLNLSHTWGNTNDPTVACGDDSCFDTPDTKGHNSCTNRFDFTCDLQTLSSTYNFADVDSTSGTTDPTAALTVLDSGLTLGSFSAIGVSANSNTNGMFDFDGWDTGAINGETVYANLTGSLNTGKYYEFTITPKPDRALTLTGITFTIKRDSAGVRTFAVRSSKDGYAANLAASITPANTNLSVQSGNVFFVTADTTVSLAGSKITLSGASFTNINNGPITFRIYGFNAEDVAGTFGVDNLNVAGTYGTIENVENYMEYSYCSKMFTNDQKDRMRAALTSTVSGRNNLWSVSNLAATGITPSGSACAPKANFFSNKTTVCTGGSVIFTKAITLGTATSTKFYFDGGTPATSTASTNTVTVTYNTPGVYPVSLVATNAQGTDSVYKSYLITVGNAYGDFNGNGYSETFQDENSFWYNWRVNNPDANANTWGIANVGYNSSKSAVMEGYLNYLGDIDDMISPALNLSYITGATLSFKYSAASKATSAAEANESLKIYYSSNCGASWTILGGGTITGAALANYGYYSGYYVPNASSNWVSKTLTLPAGASVQNVRFKFEYKTGAASNNLYIDDININGVVGITEQANNFNLAIYPNPTTETSTISYHLTEKGNVKLEVVDLLGKKVADVANTNQAEGDYSFTLSKSAANLTNGIYFIRLSVNNTVVTKKLVIAE